MPNQAHRLTVKEFNEQICHFRQLFGDTRFWAKPSAERQLAVNGIAFAYSNVITSTPEEEHNVRIAFDSTMTEYVRREGMLVMSGRAAL